MMKALNIAFRGVGSIDVTKLKLTAQSAHTVLVPHNAPADELARQVDATQASLALVMDDAGAVCGVIAPGWVRNQLSNYKGIRAQSLGDALTQFASDPAEEARNFEHEWLNEERVSLHWCSIGKHYTDPPKCAKHGV